MVVLLEDSPISTEEFWSSVRVTIRFLLTSLTKEVRSPPTAQFVWVASSRESLGSSKFLPVKNYGGHCLLGFFLHFCFFFLYVINIILLFSCLF